jgi:hypothetical protein
MRGFSHVCRGEQYSGRTPKSMRSLFATPIAFFQWWSLIFIKYAADISGIW